MRDLNEIAKQWESVMGDREEAEAGVVDMKGWIKSHLATLQR